MTLVRCPLCNFFVIEDFQSINVAQLRVPVDAATSEYHFLQVSAHLLHGVARGTGLCFLHNEGIAVANLDTLLSVLRTASTWNRHDVEVSRVYVYTSTIIFKTMHESGNHSRSVGRTWAKL